MDKLSATPNVYTSPPSGGGKIKFSIRKFITPKNIFLSLGVILLIEVIFAVKTLTAPTPPPATPPKAGVQSKAGEISLNVSKTSFQVAETVPVLVLVDTGDHQVAGVDLIVHFDPKILEATSADLVKGKIFDDYPAVSVDANKGLISISGIASLQNNFKGKGLFATLNLKAKAAGKASVTIDFQKGSTTDSNLVEASSSQDVLERVVNLELVVK